MSKDKDSHALRLQALAINKMHAQILEDAHQALKPVMEKHHRLLNKFMFEQMSNLGYTNLEHLHELLKYMANIEKDLDRQLVEQEKSGMDQSESDWDRLRRIVNDV